MKKYINQFKASIPNYFSDKEIEKTIQLCINAKLCKREQDIPKYMVEAVIDSCGFYDNPSKDVSVYFCVFYNMYFIAEKEIKEKMNVCIELNFTETFGFSCVADSEKSLLDALKKDNTKAADFKNEATKYFITKFLDNIKK